MLNLEERNPEMDITIIGDLKYQERVVQAVIEDHDFAEQIADVIKADFFNCEFVKEIVVAFFSYKEKYNSFPSADLIREIINRKSQNEILTTQVINFLNKIKQHPLHGDAAYIKDTALDFCRKMSIKNGMMRALDELADNNFDGIVKIIMDSAAKGSSRDLGHDYAKDYDARAQKSSRTPVPTPWPTLNNVFNGGWERKTLSTIIAPTGAGKTHFLCNVSAGAVEMGYNVCYISLEIQDFKIGLRHDAYFSGIPLSNVPLHTDDVKKSIDAKAKGRLYIKEFATKSASVSTIRHYLNRLKSINDFTPDVLVLDYADLLRSSKSYKEKRHDLETTYEELRGLAQEMNLVLVTADQSNRGGLEKEVVTLDAIAESYAKATVCDVILTLSRTKDDKITNSGRIFVAKSRLGQDGLIFPIAFNAALVKINILQETIDHVPQESVSMNDIKSRFDMMLKNKK